MELAAEIAVDFPEKKVTLVHEGPRGPLPECVGEGVEMVDLEGSRGALAAVHRLRFGRRPLQGLQHVGRKKDHGGVRTVTSCAPDGRWPAVARGDDDEGQVGQVRKVDGLGEVSSQQKSKQDSAAFKQAAVAARNIKVLIGLGRRRREGAEGGGVEAPRAKLGHGACFLGEKKKRGIGLFSFTTVSGHVPGLFVGKDLFVGPNRGSSQQCVRFELC